MNTIFRLYLFFAMVLVAFGADVKFSSLPTATSPSTNSFVPIIDLNLPVANQNEKYLLTNLATVAYANTNVPRFSFASKLVATDASSNAVAASGNYLLPGSLTITNSALSNTNSDLNVSEMQFLPLAGIGDQPTWRFGTVSTATNGNGSIDNSMAWSFNWGRGGQPYNTNWYSMAWKLESAFPKDGTNQFEWNLDYQSPDHLTSRRFSGITINLTNNLAEWAFGGKSFTFGGDSVSGLNSTVWTVTTNANASSFAFNGNVTASKSVGANNYIESQTNYIWRAQTLPFPSTNYERGTLSWNTANSLVLGTEANGSGSLRGINLQVGTNKVFEAASGANDVSTCAANLILGSNGTDATVQTTAGELNLKAVGTTKRVLLNASSNGTAVEVQTGAFKISKAASGTFSCSVNGADCYLTSSTATMQNFYAGIGVLGQPGSYLIWDYLGNTKFYGTNNTLVATFGPSGDVALTKTITAAGTTGTQTINKTTGRVNFAAGAQTLVVTNSFATANSIVIATVATDDATALSVKAIPAAGQFTLKLNATATAETAVAWLLTN